jgi:hypothetical protein
MALGGRRTWLMYTTENIYERIASFLLYYKDIGDFFDYIGYYYHKIKSFD